MLIIISPAKTLDLDPQNQIRDFTIPDFLQKAELLINELRNFSPKQLQDLLSINWKLAILNAERHIKWHLPFDLTNSKQALLTFKGEVYRGISSENYSKQDLLYAQDHLRILSGLYGILRPLDLIQAYRLEMGIPLKNPKGNDLYRFWEDAVTDSIALHLKETNTNTLVNLTSSEYFKSIQLKSLKNTNIITPVFLERRNGTYKTIIIYMKKARGLMTSFILKNRISNSEEIKFFDWEGYKFNQRLSEDNYWVFTR